MAKWGEGDPRWIVEERADATNVNNWHWTEKNATPWSKDKLKELLTGLKIENEEFSCKIKEVTKCDGEASANNRKAKLIFFYEWVLSGDWEGTLKNGENKTAYKGTFEVPNLSEEHDPKDVDVVVTIKDSKQEKMKEFMRIKGGEKIREQFALYINLLREEFSQGLILPTKGATGNGPLNSSSTDKSSKSSSSLNNGDSKTKNAASSSSEPVKIETKKLVMTEEFKCRVGELYNVFSNPDMVKAFTHSSKIVYEPEKAGKYALFDGNISGTFIELTHNSKISMFWRNKRWPEEHYSVATLEFNEKEDHTQLVLTQTGIPQAFLENTEDGWRNFYFNSIRQTFGYGSRLI